MNNSDQFNELLKQALSSSAEPSEELNEKLIHQLKNKDTKSTYKKRASVILIAAIITLTMSITTLAAWHLLSPKQVAEHFEDQRLAKAFENKDAITINESVVSGGYNFTLLGIVSGKGLSDFESSRQDIHPDRTYAVVSIEKEDGSEMPDTQDEEYGKVPFFISPLIKGQKPWQVNIASMNGGYSEFVIDGVMYRLIECDGVEIFADRGLYLSISTSDFYDMKAFNYNEETGEVSANTNYNGANALFDLPLDEAKADYGRAEEYLKKLLKEPENESDPEGLSDIIARREEIIANAVVIPESIKEVTYDDEGLACYEYEGHKVGVSMDYFFKEEEIGVYKTVSISSRTAIQFIKDEDGVITGRALRLK